MKWFSSLVAAFIGVCTALGGTLSVPTYSQDGGFSFSVGRSAFQLEPVYLQFDTGSNVVSIADPAQTPSYLCFTAEEPNSTVSMAAVGSAPAVTLEYSRNGLIWETFAVGSTVVTLTSVGDRVYFRCGNDTGNARTGLGTGTYNKFVMTGKIAASGNVNSLLSRYFYERSHITSSCFEYLFYGCTSLTTAPELPATSLAEGCYHSMFRGCTSLTTAPELPATSLVEHCYSAMFWGCTSLTTAPELPATELVNLCYTQMFKDCTRLNDINVNFTDWSSAVGTSDWVDGVSSTGTFTCPSALPETRGDDYIPEGWTVIRK